MTRSRRPYLVVLAAWAVYFAPLFLRPTGLLYADHSDFLADHYPAKRWVAHAWQATGEFPLWCPVQFCGAPVAHDVLIAPFYPPHLLALNLPVAAVGPALSWLTALHMLLAGLFTVRYVRSHGFGRLGATLAGLGVMFAGKWVVHLLFAGQAVVGGLCWLPLVLWGVETGRRTGAVLAGAALGLMALGTHPQWTLYAGLFAVAWTFKPRRAWVVSWLVCGTVGIAVAAVQLLPAREATPFTTRALGVASAGDPTDGVRVLLGLIGPGGEVNAPAMWEFRGLFAWAWVASAVAAIFVLGKPVRRYGWVLAGVAGFAVVGSAAAGVVPGLNLFRLPVRMLLFAAFPVAYLTGALADHLWRTSWHPEAVATVRGWVVRVGLFVAVPCLLLAGLELRNGTLNPTWAWYAGATAVTLPLALWATRPTPTGWEPLAWLAVLLIDLMSAAGRPVWVKSEGEIYPANPTDAYLVEHCRPGLSRAIDTDTGSGDAIHGAAFGGGAPLTLVRGFETPRGLKGLDVRHYREFLQFVAGRDEPVRAYTPFGFAAVPNFPVKHPALFDQLNVAFRVAPADADVGPGWVPVLADPAPVTFNLNPGGLRALAPHRVYRAEATMPRAYVVGRAERLPPGHELDSLTATDFFTTVRIGGAVASPPTETRFAAAEITEYLPNRVRVKLPPEHLGGWLVLGDVWYPGWLAEVDGQPVPVERANHAFRAVPIPDGAGEVAFRFAPHSVRTGMWVSLAALAVVALAVAAECWYTRTSPP